MTLIYYFTRIASWVSWFDLDHYEYIEKLDDLEL